MPSLKQTLKRSKSAHAAYKFARNVKTFPLNRLAAPSQVTDVLKVLPNTMVPFDGLFNAYDCVQTVDRDRIPGDLAECGVHAGGCAGLMALANAKGGLPRRYHLFDSFQGLPQPTSRDGDVIEFFRVRKKELRTCDDKARLEAAGACVGPSCAEVQTFLTQHLAIPSSKLTFYPGWFQETVPVARLNIDRLAILRLDGDLYDSTMVCLEGLYDKLNAGGFLIVDDYGSFTGCREAVAEFFAKRGIVPAMIPVDDNIHYMRKC